jgi:hypothetical protein
MGAKVQRKSGGKTFLTSFRRFVTAALHKTLNVTPAA